MSSFLSVIQEILSTPAILVGLIAFVGLMHRKNLLKMSLKEQLKQLSVLSF